MPRHAKAVLSLPKKERQVPGYVSIVELERIWAAAAFRRLTPSAWFPKPYQLSTSRIQCMPYTSAVP